MPIHLKNIYNSKNIFILTKSSILENIPSQDEIFEDSTTNNTHDAQNSWRQARKEIILKYKALEYCGYPTSLYFFKVACSLGKENKELLWYAIIGVTSLFVAEKINKKTYLKYINEMKMYCNNLNSENQKYSIDLSYLKQSNILKLIFYKHWNAYESIINTVETASLFRLYNEKGKERLDEFLAKLGCFYYAYFTFYVFLFC